MQAGLAGWPTYLAGAQQFAVFMSFPPESERDGREREKERAEDCWVLCAAPRVAEREAGKRTVHCKKNKIKIITFKITVYAPLKKKIFSGDARRERKDGGAVPLMDVIQKSKNLRRTSAVIGYALFLFYL